MLSTGLINEDIHKLKDGVRPFSDRTRGDQLMPGKKWLRRTITDTYSCREQPFPAKPQASWSNPYFQHLQVASNFKLRNRHRFCRFQSSGILEANEGTLIWMCVDDDCHVANYSTYCLCHISMNKFVRRHKKGAQPAWGGAPSFSTGYKSS
jgi:hypothetical protein